MYILSPSILAADFANMERDLKAIADGGAQYVHVDVMDGHFVPNITFGPDMVKKYRTCTDKIFDVHLMVTYPEKFIKAFIDAGADIINVHYESSMNFDNVYKIVKENSKKIAMTINPETDPEVLKPYLSKLDMVLVMSVHPGYGGQKFIESSLDKVRKIREWAPEIDIEIDGGINLDNLSSVIDAGANVIVAGSSVYNSENVIETCQEFLKRGN